MYDDDMDFLFEPENDSDKKSNNNEVDLNSFSGKDGKRKHTKSKNSKSGRKKSDKKRHGKEKRSVKKVVLTAFLVAVISVCLIIGSVAVYLFNFYDYGEVDNLDELKLNLTTTIYVQSKTTGEWEEYQRLYSEENRIWISLDDMPKDLQNAFISVEDERFYEHAGVDWKRTAYAFANSIFHFSSTQGGSTINQQLIKNLTGERDQTASRKIKEILRALDIDEKYSKDTILECYLNTISLGGTMCGVEVASNYYYGKPAKEMTLNECAALAAMVKGPEIYRPDKFPEKNKERRKLVLKKMLELGKITKAQYDEAVNEELLIVASDYSIKKIEINSYFVDALIDNVIDDLSQKYNYDKTTAEKKFYTGGYKIYSSLDPDIQNTMENVFLDTDKYFTQKSKSNSEITPEAAMTIMDYQGHIVAMVGGKGVKDRNRGLNRAYDSPRQPGSTMKPIGSYALAIDKNLITYSSIVVDEPIKNYFGNGKAGPKNWYNSYRGNITVKYALQQSVNTIPCKLVNELGIDTCYNFLTSSLGMKHMTDADKNISSLGIGGCHYGITTTESAAAYAIFGNGGNYYTPVTYYKVTNQSGDEVILKPDDPINAIGEDSATVMNYLLQNVINAGTGGGARGYSKLPTYAKTGTADASNDLWFVGGSPYYVGSVWYGFDKSERINAAAAAQRIWVAVMKDVHKDLEYKDFNYSDNVVKKSYCSETGLVASAGCPVGGTGYYKKSYAPVCSDHKDSAPPETSSEPNQTSSEVSSSAASSSSSHTDTSSTESSSSTTSSEGGQN